MKRVLGGVAAATMVVVLGACSSGYSSSDLQKDLESKGQMKPETAKCVADAVESEGIDVSKFESAEKIDDAVPKAQQEVFAKALVDCALKEVGGSGVSIPDLTTPDISIPDLTVPDISVPDITVPGSNEG